MTSSLSRSTPRHRSGHGQAEPERPTPSDGCAVSNSVPRTPTPSGRCRAATVLIAVVGGDASTCRQRRLGTGSKSSSARWAPCSAPTLAGRPSAGTVKWFMNRSRSAQTAHSCPLAHGRQSRTPPSRRAHQPPTRRIPAVYRPSTRQRRRCQIRRGRRSLPGSPPDTDRCPSGEHPRRWWQRPMRRPRRAPPDRPASLPGEHRQRFGGRRVSQPPDRQRNRKSSCSPATRQPRTTRAPSPKTIACEFDAQAPSMVYACVVLRRTLARASSVPAAATEC